MLVQALLALLVLLAFLMLVMACLPYKRSVDNYLQTFSVLGASSVFTPDADMIRDDYANHWLVQKQLTDLIDIDRVGHRGHPVYLR